MSAPVFAAFSMAAAMATMREARSSAFVSELTDAFYTASHELRKISQGVSSPGAMSPHVKMSS